jgi:REP element-mobilizing transposase RayT
MQDLTVVHSEIDLSQPAESARGRYWHNLHLVLVVERHARIHDISVLRTLRDSFLKVAARKGHAVSRISVMQGHLHALVRAQPQVSPLEIVFAYQNNLAYRIRQSALWSKGFYVGTFGEYSMRAIRNRLEHDRREGERGGS